MLVGSPNEEAANQAMDMIHNLTREVEVGGIYTGKVTRLMNFGAFVEVLPGKEGLVHISELADYRVPSVEDVVQVGDEIMVMVTEIDRMGRINLSRRAVLDKLSQIPGARLGTDQKESPSYPFKRQTEPRRPRPYRDEDRGYGDGRASRERPKSVPPKRPPH